MYLAGFIPGFMLAIVMMLMMIVVAKIWPQIAPPEQLVSWRLRFVGLLGMIPVFGIIFVVLALAVINNSGPAIFAWLLKLLNYTGGVSFLPPLLGKRPRRLVSHRGGSLRSVRRPGLGSD